MPKAGGPARHDCDRRQSMRAGQAIERRASGRCDAVIAETRARGARRTVRARGCSNRSPRRPDVFLHAIDLRHGAKLADISVVSESVRERATRHVGVALPGRRRSSLARATGTRHPLGLSTRTLAGQIAVSFRARSVPKPTMRRQSRSVLACSGLKRQTPQRVPEAQAISRRIH